MMDMIDYCRTKTVEEILEIGDVRERVDRYFEQDKLFREMIEANTTLRSNIIVLDLRNQEEIFTGTGSSSTASTRIKIFPFRSFGDFNGKISS